MVKYSSDQLDSVFMALSDPTRRAILERLAKDDVAVTELAEPFDMSLPAISKHLDVLERAGLLHREKDGRIRRCRMEHKPLQYAADWIDWYRQFWDVRLARLDNYLGKATRKKQTGEQNRKK
jgi:DNA-binding transcriptional ArsR family regulator